MRKTSVRPESRIESASSFGVFWRSAPSTSAIMRSMKDEPGSLVIFTLIQSDKHHRAAGHGAAVAAGFADDRRRFAGDGAFVDRGEALDDVAIAGDQFARLDDDDVAAFQLRRRNRLERADRRVGRGQFLRDEIRFGAPQALGLRLAAPFGDSLGEGREQDGEPQPGGDLAGEARLAGVAEEIAQPQHRDQRRHHFGDEDHRVAQQLARIELDEGVF